MTRKQRAKPSQQQLDLQFMTSPDDWPRWPLLPVKRHKQPGWPPEVGILFADGRPIVLLVSMYSLDDLPGETYSEKFSRLKRIEYKTFDELKADGWQVD